MTAPEPPAVYWCARTGELATDYTAGMVYLDEHHRPPDDAVRLVPDEPRHEVTCPSCGATIRARMADVSQVGRCGVRTPPLYPAQRLADVPVCTLPAEHAGWHRDADTGAEWGQMRDEHPGVAALLRRCDEIEPTGHGYGRIAVAEVRALLGGER